MEDLIAEIMDDLKVELASEVDYNEGMLTIKVKNAIKEVRKRRNYKASSYEEDEIINDLRDNFYTVIYNVALYDYGQIGAFGESQHSENGTLRGYQDRNSLFAGVNAFVEFL